MTAAPGQEDPTTVVVLGMHRSGTSLVSSIVQALGVFGGDEDERLPGDAWNARGYFEVRAVVSLNARLLRTDGFELSLPPIELGWEPRSDAVGALLREARELAESFRARGAGQWVWKDPRFAMTLPWWRPVLGRVAPVLCLRHPSAIAASLARRDRFPVASSVALWEVYLRHALWSCRETGFLPVRYEDAIRDPIAVANSLHAFLTERGVRVNAVESSAIDALVARDLRHFDATDDAILDDRQRRLAAMAETGRVDSGFLHATETDCLPHRPQLLELTVMSLRAELERTEESAEFHRQQAEAGQRTHAEARAVFDSERAFLREQLANLQARHGALDTAYRELQAWVEDRNAAIEWWQTHSAELEVRLEELRARSEALAAELESIRHRSFLRRLFPPRTSPEAP